MIIVIVFDVLIFLIGFIGGFLYKIVFFRPKTQPMPYTPTGQPPYVPAPYAIPTIDDLKFELKQTRILLSANLFSLALQSGRMNNYIYKEYGGEYKKLKLEELALVEKINKINKDNGASK